MKTIKQRKKYDRERTIFWLEQNQSYGAFEGFLEDDMSFKNLSDDDLKWYFNHWVLADKQSD